MENLDYYDAHIPWIHPKLWYNDHIMNKDEAKMLRQLCAKHHCSKEEIRCHKTFRIKLSMAQKKGQLQSSVRDKGFRYLKKIACRSTKLAFEHPITIKKMDELIQNNRYFGRPLFDMFAYWTREKAQIRKKLLSKKKK